MKKKILYIIGILSLIISIAYFIIPPKYLGGINECVIWEIEPAEGYNGETMFEHCEFRNLTIGFFAIVGIAFLIKGKINSE